MKGEKQCRLDSIKVSLLHLHKGRIVHLALSWKQKEEKRMILIAKSHSHTLN